MASKRTAASPPSKRQTAKLSVEKPAPGSRGKAAASKPAARPGRPTSARTAPDPIRIASGSGLTVRDIEAFRDALVAKRNEILGDINAMHSEAKKADGESGDLSTMPMHMADLGTDNFERELTLGLLEGEKSLLRELDEALERIKAGTYGLCIATGKPIGKARLKAQPWTRYSYEHMLRQDSTRRFRY